jgi:hypothetical protein
VSLLTHKLGGGRLLRGVGKMIPKNIPLPYPGDDLFWMLLRKSEVTREELLQRLRDHDRVELGESVAEAVAAEREGR